MAEAEAAKQAWDKFVKHLNEKYPLRLKDEKGKRLPYVNLMGSIGSYEKLFIEANGQIQPKDQQ